MGDGTAELARLLPSMTFTGCDFSPPAVERASATFPEVPFICRDLVSEDSDQWWDIVFSSNTLEHFRNPWEVVARLGVAARMAVVLLVPFRELERIPEHFYTFTEGNTPVLLGGRFALVHCATLDCSSLPDTQWSGQQALLVYARVDAEEFAALPLSAMSIDTDALTGSTSPRVGELSAELVEARARATVAEGRLALEQASEDARRRERDLLFDRNRELSARFLQAEAENMKLQTTVARVHASLRGAGLVPDVDQAGDADHGDLAQAIRDGLWKLHAEAERLRTLSDDSARLRRDVEALQEAHADATRLKAELEDALGALRNADDARMEMRRELEVLQSRVASRDADIEAITQLVEEFVGTAEGSWSDPAGAQRELAHPERVAHALRSFAYRRGGSDLNRTGSSLADTLRQNELLRASLADVRRALDTLSVQVQDSVRQAVTGIQRLGDEGRAVLASRSWRLTSPLRRGMALLTGAQPQVSLPVEATESSIRASFEALERQVQSLSRSISLSAIADTVKRRVYIFTGVPFDDIGGGQRAAQLARVLLERGEEVTYVYAYRKWESGTEVESTVTLPGLTHLFAKDVDWDDLMSTVGDTDVAIFELPHPAFLGALHRLNSSRAHVVFELIDAWDSSLGGDWFSEQVYADYLGLSSRVVGTARVLQQDLIRRGRDDAEYLPNAVNERIFDAYVHRDRPSDLPDRGRVLLYFGSLYGEWFDWGAVRLAALRSPQDSICLIGDPPAPVDGLPANVVLLGSRRIEQLPAYLAHADIALLPFTPGKISDAVSPIKIFEYIAMQKPVVSMDLPEVRGYPNVHVASSAEHFAELCAQPLHAQSSVDLFVSQNSWAARADALVRIPPRGDVTAVILIHNNAAIVERCLSTLLHHGRDYLAEVIVVDNASSDGGAELVERLFPQVTLLRNERNGCSSGRNLAIQRVRSEFIVFLDSDQWFTSRGAFEQALRTLESNPGIGAVGWAAGWFTPGETLGGPIVDYLPGRGTQSEQYRLRGYRTDIAYLGSGGLFLRADVARAVGGFDEAYDPTCFEDTDFSLSIKHSGLELAYVDLQGIRHQAHQTTGASGGSEAYRALFARNSDHFKGKWAHRGDLIFDAPSM